LHEFPFHLLHHLKGILLVHMLPIGWIVCRRQLLLLKLLGLRSRFVFKIVLTKNYVSG
jgi:hypothetical protein